jgi:hypothetical protein
MLSNFDDTPLPPYVVPSRSARILPLPLAHHRSDRFRSPGMVAGPRARPGALAASGPGDVPPLCKLLALVRGVSVPDAYDIPVSDVLVGLARLTKAAAAGDSG